MEVRLRGTQGLPPQLPSGSWRPSNRAHQPSTATRDRPAATTSSKREPRIQRATGAVARAAKKQPTARESYPSAPAMKWIIPPVLIEVGYPSGGADGESVDRVGREHGGHDHARAESAEKPARGARLRSEGAPDPHGGGEHHRAGEDEVRGLNPSAGAVGQETERVPREVESVPDEGLDQADGEIERARQGLLRPGSRSGDRRPGGRIRRSGTEGVAPRAGPSPRRRSVRIPRSG